MSRRVVVVGNGMAAARLVDELRRRDPDGSQVAPLVVGEEPHPAYNRVLLSTVLAGGLDVDAVRLASRTWHADNGVDVRTGVRVTGIDREQRRVACDDGSTEAYDVLVLATGSTPVLPPVPGLVGAGGTPSTGVVVFRTVDDCHAILDAVAAAGAGVREIGRAHV